MYECGSTLGVGVPFILPAQRHHSRLTAAANIHNNAHHQLCGRGVRPKQCQQGSKLSNSGRRGRTTIYPTHIPRRRDEL